MFEIFNDRIIANFLLSVIAELDMGRVHPRVSRVGSGWVGSGPDFSLLSGSGRVGSICVGLCGSPWIIQNVTVSVFVKFTQFSELLVLLKLFSV